MSEAKKARSLSKSKLYGVLSTISISVPDYPFGSLVRYCIDDNGNYILLLAKLAEHTQNFMKNDKVSLTIVEDEATNIQDGGRLTILGRMTNCNEDPEILELYRRFFPDIFKYGDLASHGFLEFFRLNVEKIRYISGFGGACWIAKEDFLIKQIFSKEQIDSIIEHMNEPLDNRKAAMRKYCNIQSTDDSVKMLHVDQEGTWFRKEAQTQVIYVPLTREIIDTETLRTVMIEMAKAC